MTLIATKNLDLVDVTLACDDREFKAHKSLELKRTSEVLPGPIQVSSKSQQHGID